MIHFCSRKAEDEKFYLEKADWEGFMEETSQKKIVIENGSRILIKEDGYKTF